MKASSRKEIHKNLWAQTARMRRSREYKSRSPKRPRTKASRHLLISINRTQRTYHRVTILPVRTRAVGTTLLLIHTLLRVRAIRGDSYHTWTCRALDSSEKSSTKSCQDRPSDPQSNRARRTSFWLLSTRTANKKTPQSQYRDSVPLLQEAQSSTKQKTSTWPVKEWP